MHGYILAEFQLISLVPDPVHCQIHVFRAVPEAVWRLPEAFPEGGPAGVRPGSENDFFQKCPKLIPRPPWGLRGGPWGGPGGPWGPMGARRGPLGPA